MQYRIISASRRTDLPGFHAQTLVERLRRLRKPVHSVFFWTRHPSAFSKRTCLGAWVHTEIENPFVHLTLTGLGGTAIEPRAPSTRVALNALESLIEVFGGEPRRILWRFDPIIHGQMSLPSFDSLAHSMSALGIEQCIISFPANQSLKGQLFDQYTSYAIATWSRQERLTFALGLAERAEKHGLLLSACAQPELVLDSRGVIPPASCISTALAQKYHPRHLLLDLPKDPSQRKHCHCALSHDIGRYDDLCQSGCVYCYSKAGGPHHSSHLLRTS